MTDKAVDLSVISRDVPSAVELSVSNSRTTDFTRQILWYLWAFSAFCGFIILIDGFHPGNFHLDTIVLTTLVGSTAASAFGLVSIVLAGVFKGALTAKAPN